MMTPTSSDRNSPDPFHLHRAGPGMDGGPGLPEPIGRKRNTRRVFLTLVVRASSGARRQRRTVRSTMSMAFTLRRRSLAAGGMYHQIMTQTGNLRGDPNATVETWVDAAQGYARQDEKFTAEQQAAYGDGTGTIIQGNVRLDVRPDGSPVSVAVTCHGVSAAVAMVLHPVCQHAWLWPKPHNHSQLGHPGADALRCCWSTGAPKPTMTTI